MTEPSGDRKLLILGASARAAAFSALRADYCPIAGDLFADTDLAAVCPVARVHRYPQGLLAIARTAPSSPWMYVGALENHPGLVDRVSPHRLLWGNPGHVLRRVRDPETLFPALAQAGFSVPPWRRDSREVSTDGRWLRKPLRSSAGTGIAPWSGEPGAVGSDYYFQRFLRGRSCSAVYVGAGGKSRLVGISEQLIGQRWTGAENFRYCGTIGPLSLAEELLGQFRRLGHVLAGEFGLNGLFGVDALVDDRTVWPLEVNPRYTASVEVFERAWDVPLLAWHAAACRDGELSPLRKEARSRSVGKAILYARSDLVVTTAVLRRLGWNPSGESSDWRMPSLADIPREGTRISAGHPLLTVFADGSNPRDALAALRRRARDVWRAL